MNGISDMLAEGISRLRENFAVVDGYNAASSSTNATSVSTATTSFEHSFVASTLQLHAACERLLEVGREGEDDDKVDCETSLLSACACV